MVSPIPSTCGTGIIDYRLFGVLVPSVELTSLGVVYFSAGTIERHWCYRCIVSVSMLVRMIYCIELFISGTGIKDSWYLYCFLGTEYWIHPLIVQISSFYGSYHPIMILVSLIHCISIVYLWYYLRLTESCYHLFMLPISFTVFVSLFWGVSIIYWWHGISDLCVECWC